MMGNRDTPSDLDKPQSGRYSEIQIQSLIDHTTHNNENPLYFQMTQTIEIEYP